MESKKQKQLRLTAHKLFWKFGIKRVSIEEICKEADVSKGTFYKYFKNKNELLKYFFDFLYSENLLKYRKIMQQDIALSEKFEQIIQFKIEIANEMSNEFFEDFYKNAEPDILKYQQKHINTSRKIFMDDVIEAQNKGEIRKDISPQFIMYFYNQMIEWIKDETLISIYNSPEALLKEITQFFFYAILPKSKNDK